MSDCKLTMFNSFKDLENYIPNNRPKPAPEPPEANRTNSLSNLWPLLNTKEEIIGAEWNWGNPVDLPFEIKGNIIDDNNEYIDLETFFTGRSLTFEILDQFYETYLTFVSNGTTFVQTSEAGILIFEITEAMSKQFRQGTNHIRITIDDLGVMLYHPEDCVLEVK